MTTHDAVGQIDISYGFSLDAKLTIASTGTIPIAVFTVVGNVIASPRVSSATVKTSTKIRVKFDQEMLNDSRLTLPQNYTVTPMTDGVNVYVSSVVAENVDYPTYVDLTTTEMTDGQNYQISVETGTGGPYGRFDIALNPLGNTTSIVGVGDAPTILQIEAISQNQANVKFSEPMLDNAAIRNVDSYSFDGGLTVISVLDVDVDTVKLVTSDQTPGTVYVLTID
jgi:hypothetical protein